MNRRIKRKSMLNFQKYNDIHKLSFVFKKEITNSLESIYEINYLKIVLVSENWYSEVLTVRG